MDYLFWTLAVVSFIVVFLYKHKLNDKRLENLKLAADLKYKSDLLTERNNRVADLISENDKVEQVRLEVKRLNEQALTSARNLRDKTEEVGLLKSKLLEKEAAFLVQVKEERKDAVAVSRSVIKGQIAENMIPLLPDFPYQTGDSKFLGQPIDYIVFRGMSENDVTEIIILDVKTGNAKLNKVQRQIRDCIKEGKVTFKTLKPNLTVYTEVLAEETVEKA